MSPKEETPARPLTQGVGKGLPIKISNGEYFVVEDGVILISANTAGNTSGHFLLVFHTGFRDLIFDCSMSSFHYAR